MELQGVETRKHVAEQANGSLVSEKELQLEMKVKDDSAEKEKTVSWSCSMFHQPYLNLGILYIMGFKTKINPDMIKEEFANVMLNSFSLSRLQFPDKKGRGNMKSVPTKVDIEKHVIVPSLDTSKDNPDKVVEDYISKLRETPLDLSKPLWEYHILNIKTSEAEATGVFWVHHSLGDGSFLMAEMLSISRSAANPESLPTLPKKKTKRQVQLHGFARFREYLFKIWSVLVLLWNTIINVWSLVATLLILKDTDTPLRRLHDVEYAPRRFVHRTVRMDDVKLVKNVMQNATINDVVLGITQAALSRYIHRIYDKNKTDEGERNVKRNFTNKGRVKAAVMVDIRSSLGTEELADMLSKKSRGKWANCVGFIFLPLYINKREDSLEYIRRAKAIIDQKKKSLEALISFYGASLIAKLFGPKTVGAVIHKFWSQTTMTFSNVMGPTEEITFVGHPVEYLVPTAYGTPQALIIHVHSYAGKVTFGLSVDERNIPNPHQLCDDIEESLRLMKEAAMAKAGFEHKSPLCLNGVK